MSQDGWGMVSTTVTAGEVLPAGDADIVIAKPAKHAIVKKGKAGNAHACRGTKEAHP